MTTAKICGLSTTATLDAAIRHGASHVGFVFFPASPRHVTFAKAAELAANVPGHVAKVGVFVDPEDEMLEQAVASAALDVLQLHKVTPARTAAIRAKFGIEIWVAVAVRTRGDLDVAQGFAGVADRILYDAKTPEGAALPGGMGLRFDWELLRGFRHPLPWALSGGLDPVNVAEAIRRTGADLVDVSSGVESEPGIKDEAKIAAFLRATTT
ncbi:phosphoribosylanthranilate isomerase [Sphingomonas sp. R86521]|uniref:phosphoribosylanthranilate isomerase n=1 Tax=Sphingomonas sp. R86521 TaxID=3093860 RepID=UPI0036D34771